MGTPRPVLWLVATAAFMQMLDTTIVNTALPSMAASLGESPLRMQAVVASYALAVAMVIPASGWLADRFGTRGVFLTAVVLFSLGSLACALSRGLTELVASRVLQGIGGAMLLPVGRLVVMRVVPRTEFLAAMSFVTLPGLIGPLIGPTLGGCATLGMPPFKDLLKADQVKAIQAYVLSRAKESASPPAK